jgi:poly-gamma-glutamate capsule biosynthesis protein CapA/YwtB (metallophosphatase superfamily)
MVRTCFVFFSWIARLYINHAFREVNTRSGSMDEEISFTAVGDCFITRHLQADDQRLIELSKIIKDAEVRVANLEVTVHDGSPYPSAESGGTWAIASPDVLYTLRDYGFNLIGWANNHTLDYLHSGLLETKKNLDLLGFTYAGAGENLAQASAPKYLECRAGRVAFIAATTSAPSNWIAGEQRRDGPGRPGVNLLRWQQVFDLTSEKINQLKEIARLTAINAENDMSLEEGFLPVPAEGIFLFGNYQFREASEVKQTYEINTTDMERILNSIEEAKRKADYVILSLHTHELEGKSLPIPPSFVTEFCRKCIDQGTDAVIGHGPHILRGIEIYKGRPIFYSLGNFIYQPETVNSQPADMYYKHGLSDVNNVADALDSMSANYTRGHSTIREMWEAIVPYWRVEDGRLVEIKLYPVELGFGLPIHRMGWPVLSNDQLILEKLQRLSEPLGTKIDIDGCVGRVQIT